MALEMEEQKEEGEEGREGGEGGATLITRTPILRIWGKT